MKSWQGTRPCDQRMQCCSMITLELVVMGPNVWSMLESIAVAIVSWHDLFCDADMDGFSWDIISFEDHAIIWSSKLTLDQLKGKEARQTNYQELVHGLTCRRWTFSLRFVVDQSDGVHALLDRRCCLFTSWSASCMPGLQFSISCGLHFIVASAIWSLS